MKLLLLLALCSVAFKNCCAQAIAQGVDLTLTPSASGPDVARAVLSKINASRAFNGSSTSMISAFMRRLAYVESRDGRATPYPAGGIWNVSLAIFRNTQTTYGNVIPVSVFNTITSYFGFNWMTEVQFENLTKPLYSGLAVRLQLYYLENIKFISIPAKLSQDDFWIDNILGLSSITATERKGLQTRWNNAVQEIEETEGNNSFKIVTITTYLGPFPGLPLMCVFKFS